MKTILEKLEENAKKYPNKILFSDENNRISFKDFVLASKSLALTLIKKGYKNQPIAVYDNRNVQTLISMFAVMYSGNFYVVIDSSSPIERITKIYDILKPVFSVCLFDNKNVVNKLCQVEDTCIFEDYFDDSLKPKTKISASDERLLKSAMDKLISTDPAYALFTSGSTGLPKGAIVSHLNILSYIQWFTTQFKIGKDTIFGNQTPFYFSMSVSDIFASVYAGATFNIIPKKFFSFPVKLVEFLNDRQINTIYWVPSALCIVANIKLFDYVKPEYLQKVLFAGEVMPNKQLNYWRKHLPDVTYANLFGPTETTDICTFYQINREFRDDESLPIGKPCDNCHTFIVDENGKEIIEAGKAGELYARGAFVAYGYFDNQEKTKAAFVQNPLHNHYPEIVYRTGDLVKLNQYGEYEYVGRKDFQIKHMGYRIELGEIETAASCEEKVNSAVCIYDAAKDIIVMVYEGRQKEDVLSEHLQAKVPQYMMPNLIIKVGQMPYNQNGKIDRAWLKSNYNTLIK